MFIIPKNYNAQKNPLTMDTSSRICFGELRAMTWKKTLKINKLGVCFSGVPNLHLRRANSFPRANLQVN